ncbi:thermonuclease family protein [Microbacter sp. GSS18]|nr:thermonuclease family protein [Microbacter sp. GSS18]
MISTARRRRSSGVGAVLALAAVGLIALAWLALTDRLGPLEGSAPSAPVAQPPSAAVPGPPSDAFAITVTSVIDGDTVKAHAQDPNPVMPGTESVSVRLIGIDTPETYPDEECWGPEATDALRALAPEGATLLAAPDAEWHDRYGRVLLYLWTPDGVFVNHELVDAGAAEALRVEPNDLYAGVFADAEAAARSAGAGQWTSCF